MPTPFMSNIIRVRGVTSDFTRARACVLNNNLLKHNLDCRLASWDYGKDNNPEVTVGRVPVGSVVYEDHLNLLFNSFNLKVDIGLTVAESITRLLPSNILQLFQCGWNLYLQGFGIYRYNLYEFDKTFRPMTTIDMKIKPLELYKSFIHGE